MSSQLEKMIQEMLGNAKTLPPDQIHTLIQEALKTFSALKEQSNSLDPKDREEAFKAALSLKQVILAQTEEICKKANIDPAQFAALAGEEAGFSPETWVELSSAKKELEQMRSQLGMKSTKHHPHTKKSNWIPG